MKFSTIKDGDVTLSINVVVKKVIEQITNISVPIEESELSINKDGTEKINGEKLLEKALKLARENEHNWKEDKITYLINEFQS